MSTLELVSERGQKYIHIYSTRPTNLHYSILSRDTGVWKRFLQVARHEGKLGSNCWSWRLLARREVDTGATVCFQLWLLHSIRWVHWGESITVRIIMRRHFLKWYPHEKSQRLTRGMLIIHVSEFLLKFYSVGRFWTAIHRLSEHEEANLYHNSSHICIRQERKQKPINHFPTVTFY